MSASLAPARGTIEYKLPAYESHTKFFNMYDSVDTLSAFEPVEVVGYPTHCMELVKADGEGDWATAVADDELLLVVQGALTVRFREGDSQVATATAVDGEILLLPRALDYRVRADEGTPALFLHLRTRS